MNDRTDRQDAQASQDGQAPPRALDFHFDFSSPYSYLAAERIDALAARYGFAVRWKPMLLGAVFRATGGASPLDQAPAKARYSIQDFARSARFEGLPYRHPSRFPQPTQAAARMFLWLQRTTPELARPFALEVFRLIFVRDGDATDVAALATIGATLGLDPDALAAAAQNPQVKQELATLVDEAIARGVFGAPTFVVDGELFWGHDRLAQLERRLREAAGRKGYRALVDEAMERVVTLPVEQAAARLAEPDTVFVDLRDPRELEREGTIPGALHAPRGMLEFWVDPDSPYHKPAFAPDKRYVLFCGGGWRSALACRAMQEMGILPDVAHVEGGFAEWKKRGAPVAPVAPRPPKT